MLKNTEFPNWKFESVSERSIVNQMLLVFLGYETDYFRFMLEEGIEFKTFGIAKNIQVNHLSQKSLN